MPRALESVRRSVLWLSRNAGINKIVTTGNAAGHADISGVDSTHAWIRLAVALVLGTIGGVGMWSFVVALPSVQAEFGILRNEASLPYTLAIVGVAFGGVLMGKLADRHGIVFPAIAGTLLLGFGYLLAGYAPNIWTLAGAHVVIGVGASGTFGPLISDMSHWFRKRRGVAFVWTLMSKATFRRSHSIASRFSRF